MPGGAVSIDVATDRGCAVIRTVPKHPPTPHDG